MHSCVCMFVGRLDPMCENTCLHFGMNLCTHLTKFSELLKISPSTALRCCHQRSHLSHLPTHNKRLNIFNFIIPLSAGPAIWIWYLDFLLDHLSDQTSTVCPPTVCMHTVCTSYPKSFTATKCRTEPAHCLLLFHFSSSSFLSSSFFFLCLRKTEQIILNMASNCIVYCPKNRNGAAD